MHGRRTYFTGWARALAIAVAAFLLGLFAHVAQLRVLGIQYIADGGPQHEYHARILRGESVDPYQYRILSEVVVEGFLRATRWIGLPDSVPFGFMAARIVQNAILLGLAAVYYRRLGLGLGGAMVGISLLTWSMSQALFDSNLAFNTYSDVIFYLAAGALLGAGRPLAVVPLMVLAALNRETSGLIPLMLVTALWEPGRQRAALGYGGLALGAFVLAYAGVRLAYGPRPLFVAYGQAMGWPMFRYNVLRPVTWLQLLGTLGILPCIALAGYRVWPSSLRRFCWAVIPAWFLIHLFTAVLAEARTVLVPQAVVFVPGALFTLRWPFRGEDTAPLDACSQASS